MEKNDRLITAIFLLLGLLGINWYLSGRFGLPTGDQSIWFHGGLFVLIVAYYWIEHFFTRPTDVIINGLIVFVSVSSLANPPLPHWWEALRYFALAVAALAFAVAWNPGASQENSWATLHKFIYLFVTKFGKAEILYSVVFGLAVLSYFEIATRETSTLVIFWLALLALKHIDMGGFIRGIKRINKTDLQIVGKVSRYFEPNILMFEALPRTNFRRGDYVSIGQTGTDITNHDIGKISKLRRSLDILEVEVVLLKRHDNSNPRPRNVFRLADPDTIGNDTPQLARRNTLIGLLEKETSISSLKFEVVANLEMAQGSVVYAHLNTGEFVAYQIVDAKVQQETSNASSLRQLALASAEQLGTWNSEKQAFQSYGWLPPLNSPIYLANTDSNLNQRQVVDNYTVGYVPNTEFPANVSIKEMTLYHTAILGITGSGKSFLAYDLIEQCLDEDIKVLCMDNTGDYRRYLRDSTSISNSAEVNAFLDSDTKKLGIIEFTDDRIHPIRCTREVCDRVLKWCKDNRTPEEVETPKAKVLIVLEEAHTLVPEWNLTPNNMRDNVNATSQVIFQARKYGLGFMIVTQRTASVTKSILNQCNTLFAFQAFDQTGFDFMKNYMGIEYVSTLPLLTKRSGVLVGKASSSDRPLIVRFKDQDRKPAAPEDNAGPLSEEMPVNERGPMNNL